MKLLALDTSTDYCSVALTIDGTITTRSERAGQRHSELLLPMVADVLSHCGARLQDLDAIAFGAGPGSFTGLRIACGVAQGLAFGAGIGVVPVPTLAALAWAEGSARVVAAIDARMGEIYLAAFTRTAAGIDEVLAVAVGPADRIALPADGDWHGVGNAFALADAPLQSRLGSRLVAADAAREPLAGDWIGLAALLYACGGSVAPAAAAPLYVRDRVASTRAERAAGR